ncbi:MAG TPA: hypothetical protein VFK52_02725 [Nocardioidaceae bacterium]|nr:hypothetical protein [Nocardioidaceae bacterium]
MRPGIARLLAAALLVATLAACSGGAEEVYCDDLETATARLVELADRSGAEGEDYLEPALALLEQLREKAPADLRDEWDTFVFAWQGLVDVLRETGVDPTTFDPASRPDGLSQQDFDKVRAVGAELRSARVRDAVEGITRHANDVCGLSLDL